MKLIDREMINKELSKIELLERYIQAAWVLKIRLMSSRRQLWDKQYSLIHLENSLLQLRKICEGISYMCVIATEVDQEEKFENFRRSYKVEKLKKLQKKHSLKFPQKTKLFKKEKQEEKTIFQLDIESEVDPQKIIDINKRCNSFLHEFTPFMDWNTNEIETKQSLVHSRNQVRLDHQWLWNHFWQHSITLKDKLFFIDLGDVTQSSQPTIIKDEGLVSEELNVKLDPDFIADFTGIINWEEYEPVD